MMNTYVILMRGINVGGKNKISMRELKQCLEDEGFEDVVTYINSGNVVLRSDLKAEAVSTKIESMLPKQFKLDSSIVKVLAIDNEVFQAIVTQAPQGFGKDIENYRYDVIFLMGVSPDQVMEQVTAREDIDKVWHGGHAIYFRRPSLTSPNRTKSYIGKLAQRPIYPFISIRNWNTTTKLLGILHDYQK